MFNYWFFKRYSGTLIIGLHDSMIHYNPNCKKRVYKFTTIFCLIDSIRSDKSFIFETNK